MEIVSLIDFSDIAVLLPHSGRMVLLDKIVEFEGESLTAELIVRADGLLGDETGMPAWAGIEYMAQAVGAYAGIKSKLAGEPIRLGYLLGTRRYSSNVGFFAVGTALTVKVINLIQDEMLGVFDCSIRGDNIKVTANLNVYQPPTESKTKTKP